MGNCIAKNKHINQTQLDEKEKEQLTNEYLKTIAIEK